MKTYLALMQDLPKFISSSGSNFSSSSTPSYSPAIITSSGLNSISSGGSNFSSSSTPSHSPAINTSSGLNSISSSGSNFSSSSTPKPNPSLNITPGLKFSSPSGSNASSSSTPKPNPALNITPGLKFISPSGSNASSSSTPKPNPAIDITPVIKCILSSGSNVSSSSTPKPNPEINTKSVPNLNPSSSNNVGSSSTGNLNPEINTKSVSNLNPSSSNNSSSSSTQDHNPAVNAKPDFNLKSAPNHNPAITTKSGLINLYNQQIIRAERVERPMHNVLDFFAKHQGIKVTLANGEQYLVHHGTNYGKSQDSVIVPAENMSSEWTSVKDIPVAGNKTVGGLMGNTGGPGNERYDLVTNNCYTSAGRGEEYLSKEKESACPAVNAKSGFNLESAQNHYPAITTKSGLTNLYNQQIIRAERVERPMHNVLDFFAKHQGIKVTLANGEQYLVHHGTNYGKSQDSVIVPAENMSSEWTSVKDIPVAGNKTVGGLMGNTGGPGNERYDLVTNNCYTSARRGEEYLSKEKEKESSCLIS